MNDDAFARRFYADRAELESLGITLQVEKPGESLQGYESELYSLPPENYYLPEIQFGDDELAALQTALQLLDGEFAYAEPLRLALQQVSWGRPSPLTAPEQSSVEVRMTAKADGAEVSQRLSKIETAISRRKTIEFTYYTIERDSEEKRKVDPYHLVYRGGQFYLIGHSHERDAIRVFRLSRIRGKVSYASKAEHDFSPPEDFERRDYARRAEWQLGEIKGDGEDLPEATASPGWSSATSAPTGSSATRAGATAPRARAGSSRPSTPRAARWSPGSCTGARTPLCSIRPSSPRRSRNASSCSRERHSADFEPANVGPHRRRRAPRTARSNGRSESSIRPERFARLVTLAGMLIESAKGEARLPVADVKDAPARHRRGAAGRHRPAQRRQLRRRHLRPLRRAAGRRDRGRRRALRRQLRPAGAAAAARGEGAGRRDRPVRRPPSAERPRQRPEEDRRGARPRPLRGGPGDRRLGRRRLRRRSQGEQGDRGPARPRDPLLQGERGRVHQARDRALPARQRPGGLVRRLI